MQSDTFDKLVAIGDKTMDLINKLAGPMAEEVGLLMGDKIRFYRVKNWISVMKKCEQLLEEARLPPNAVPPRLFLPIFEAASIENEESLQDLWAGLLASASEKADSLSPSFIETLKQLTPSEAKALNHFFEDASKLARYTTGSSFLLPPKVFQKELRPIRETFERLGILHRQYGLQQRNEPELTSACLFTEYGIRFVEACRGPARNDPSPSSQAGRVANSSLPLA
jgi:hypothetical protein